MDHSGPSQSSSSSTPPENPIAAVGRKVKETLHIKPRQQPSIRILRERYADTEPRPVPASRDFGDKPLPPVPETESQTQTQTHLRPPGPTRGESTFTNRLARSGSRAGASIRDYFARDKNSADNEFGDHEDCYDAETVDLMDVTDPEVATLNTLTNVQNSLFVPDLGRMFNRRPTYRVSDTAEEARTMDKIKNSLRRISSAREEANEKQGTEEAEGKEKGRFMFPRKPLPPAHTTVSTSQLKNAQYAILPDGKTLVGWRPQDEAELDDLVRHQLHSRRAKFKRSLKGFSQYVRRPLGLFITVYATLITLFGAAWVFFLIGWISLGSKQSYVINIVDNVLVALFAIIGDGLAPFRAVDTYHMSFIAHYHLKTWKKRAKLGLPELADHNDLPETRKEETVSQGYDLESLVAKKMPLRLARKIAPRIPKRIANRIMKRGGAHDDPPWEYSVLTPDQQAKLEYHERKFSKSHTFYKPHETETHFAFPLKLLIAVVVLLDCHSALQISLGACTWAIDYHRRPFALTTVILCCSITCNIMGGVLISIGDKRTRKKDVIERMMIQELTSDAIESMETRWMKEAEERGTLDPEVRKRREEEREEKEAQEIKRSWKSVPSLPKHLLGKGEDHRQPSLPQRERRSGSEVASPTSSASGSRVNVTGSGSKVDVKNKSGSGTVLPSVREDPIQPLAQGAVGKGEDPLKENVARKALRMIRRADLDKS